MVDISFSILIVGASHHITNNANPFTTDNTIMDLKLSKLAMAKVFPFTILVLADLVFPNTNITMKLNDLLRMATFMKNLI